MTTEAFFASARERYQIMLNRQAGLPRPEWTQDMVFAANRFCNVFREDDRVTRWMRENLTNQIPPWDYARHIRAAVVFRWFNKIETGQLLKPLLLGNWDTEIARSLLKGRVAAKQTILGAAYMIKSPLRMNKVDGLLQCIDAVEFDIPHLAANIDPEYAALEGMHEVLLTYPFLGPFMAYQMVCDMRYSPLLENAPDKMTWTCPGPGSARGLSRVLFGEVGHFDYNSTKHRAETVEHMQRLLAYAHSASGYWPAEWPQWELATVQHWLCEFDKYERVRLGEGRAKQRFSPHNAGAE